MTGTRFSRPTHGGLRQDFQHLQIRALRSGHRSRRALRGDSSFRRRHRSIAGRTRCAMRARPRGSTTTPPRQPTRRTADPTVTAADGWKSHGDCRRSLARCAVRGLRQRSQRQLQRRCDPLWQPHDCCDRDAILFSRVPAVSASGDYRTPVTDTELRGARWPRRSGRLSRKESLDRARNPFARARRAVPALRSPRQRRRGRCRGRVD